MAGMRVKHWDMLDVKAVVVGDVILGRKRAGDIPRTSPMTQQSLIHAADDIGAWGELN